MSQNQRLEISLAKLEERVESIQDDMRELKTDVTQLRATADKWRGGFWVMMAISFFTFTALAFSYKKPKDIGVKDQLTDLT